MNLNLVQICGRLTRDIEVRTTPTGTNIANFSVASNRTWKDKNGEKQQEVEYHNVVAFGRTAEIIAQYFNKGDEIYIQGRLKTSAWDDKDTGKKRYKTDIIAEKFDWGQKAKSNADQSEPANAPEPVDDEVINVEDIPF